MSAEDQIKLPPGAQEISNPNDGEPPRLWPEILVAIGIGVALIWASDCVPPNYPKLHLHSLVLELGIGFVVGAIVAITIESYMRRKQQIEDTKREREMESNIFMALFRTALPDDLVYEMYQMLFTRKFIRQDLVIAINLRPLTDDEHKKCSVNDALVLTQTVTYKAKNISDTLACHDVSPQEYALFPHPTLKHPYKSFSVSCGSDETRLDNEALFKDRVTNPGNGIWYYLEKAPKIDVPENAVVTVVSTIEMICRKTDIKTWLTYYPAERLTLTVDLAGSLQDQLEFAVDQSHRVKLEAYTSSTSDGRTLYGWTLEKPILPHQGIVLYWRPKANTGGPVLSDPGQAAPVSI
ncbi:MAG: hypothetical protein ACRD2P_03560 [Terriglobia bacterium]